jgi:hypothetical protein
MDRAEHLDGEHGPWTTIDETLVNSPGQPPDRQPLYYAWEKAVAAG